MFSSKELRLMAKLAHICCRYDLYIDQGWEATKKVEMKSSHNVGLGPPGEESQSGHNDQGVGRWGENFDILVPFSLGTLLTWIELCMPYQLISMFHPSTPWHVAPSLKNGIILLRIL